MTPYLDTLKILLPAFIAFTVGIFITPYLSHMFYKHKMWKKNSRSNTETTSNEIFHSIHNEKEETSTPRVGGMIIWLSVFITTALLFVFSLVSPSELASKFQFISRGQTLIPLALFFGMSFVGLFDDLLQIRGKGKYANDALSYRYLKIGTVCVVGLLVGWWFFSKLNFVSISVPFDGVLHLGILIIPFVALVMLATFSTSIIDGIDGLAGGVLSTSFASFAVIAFFNNQIDIAALCMLISGALLAFLWFNIPPARFWMGETGMLPLTLTLAVIAFLTDSVLLLPLIALPLTLTSASGIIQMISKKFFKKKVFLVAPLHHHFQALGWSREKITMRYWVFSVASSMLGTIIALIS
ncbi:MAG: phospho-N-acetylmuramoyl-pentapeptide-transferase [Flavobacteriaceae bacterium]|jgi:phospho-N-acetylmuramoyl-pentapeptide-transferase